MMRGYMGIVRNRHGVYEARNKVAYLRLTAVQTIRPNKVRTGVSYGNQPAFMTALWY
jgi:hypothetical protein